MILECGQAYGRIDAYSKKGLQEEILILMTEFRLLRMSDFCRVKTKAI